MVKKIVSVRFLGFWYKKTTRENKTYPNYFIEKCLNVKIKRFTFNKYLPVERSFALDEEVNFLFLFSI